MKRQTIELQKVGVTSIWVSSWFYILPKRFNFLIAWSIRTGDLAFEMRRPLGGTERCDPGVELEEDARSGVIWLLL